jgi:hypothetical protein
MSMECRICGAEIINEGSISDICMCGGETIRSFWRCKGCGKLFLNEYYDCWDSETPDDLWYDIPESIYRNALARRATCPEPANKLCDCDNHPFSIDLSGAVKIETRGGA